MTTAIPNAARINAVYSSDGGVTWSHSGRPPGGFRSAVASVDGHRFVTAGTNGSEFSDDNGAHWMSAGSLNLNAVNVLDLFHIWGVGPNGIVAKFNNPAR